MNEIRAMTVGSVYSYERVVSNADVQMTAKVTGDYNPLHIDEEFAKHTRFKARIAHGAILVGMISKILGMDSPGPGAIYLEQSLQFMAPVFIGDTIRAEVELDEFVEQNKIAKYKTRCLNQEGLLVAEGRSILMVP